jgi:excisionase family DNA binding protein
MSRGADLFTAADAARFCRVDLKTIHNWAARGKLRHYKTDGRHVRIQRVDLVAFMRHYEMPLPSALAEGKPHVVAIDGDAAALARLCRALEKRFVLDGYEHAVDALVAIGATPPQALVVTAPLAGVDVARVVARLHAVERTAHVRVVVLADESDDDVKGAARTIARDKLAVAHVREALESITGLA